MPINKLLKWFLPLAIVIILAPFTPKIDLACSQYFFSDATHKFENTELLKFIFKYGPLPAFVLGIVAFIVFCLSFIKRELKKWRSSTLSFGLALALGPGLFVNLIFKEYWGRPRPRQIIPFNGDMPYFPFYIPNFDFLHKFKSFPSGHASMGFIFLSFCIIGARLKNKALFYSGLTLTVILGGALSVTRIAQGGHFFSDVLMSAFMLWYLSLFADWIACSLEEKKLIFFSDKFR